MLQREGGPASIRRCRTAAHGTRLTRPALDYKGHVGASPVEGRRLGWFQDAEVTFSGVGMGSSLARMICSPAYAWLCALLVALRSDGCMVSTPELEHSLRSDGDVAVAVALNGRELRQVPPRRGCRLE